MQTFIQFLESKEDNKKKIYDYSSVIYLLPDKIAKKVYDWGLHHVKESHLFRDLENHTFGREDEMHCTVLYGIHDKGSKGVRNILEEVEPFGIKLGNISVFTASEKFDVVKVEVTSKDLHDLHNRIRNNLEVTEKYPEYKPHVTIAYLKKGEGGRYAGNEVFKDISMTVNNLVFSSSIGVKTPISLKN